jgi:formylglycine-generating enzyme required for sulfatase activity
MRKVFSVCGCLFLALIAGATLLLQDPGPASGQAPVKLPQVDTLEQKGYTESVKGDAKTEAKDMEAKFEMVPIPGGAFMMGSPDSEPGRNSDEGPQHAVKIRPFWMGKTEVTWDEFEIYQKEMGVEEPDQNDRRLKAKADAITGPTPPYVDQYYGHGRDGHPALCMTQHAAMEYCRWLSQKTGKTYRLPTEAEWEWAARAGTTTTYFFGNDPKDLGEYAWFVKNSAPNAQEEPQTHKVATRKPNPWGLHDMYGNVMEWCLDQYDKDAYATFAKEKLSLSPVLLPGNKRFSHVARGGSWSDEAIRCRSAARRGSDKTWIKDDPQRPQSIWWLTRFDTIGLRVIRPVEEQENLKGLRSKVTRESE